MAQFENMRKVDLKNGEPAVFSLRQLYYADIEANRIGAIVYMDGEPFALSGTCTGTAIRADGTTVPMTGTIEGNQAYITLTADCYAVEGDIQIFVKLTTGTVTATLAAARGTVRLTETSAVIDPGEIIPSVSALITAIDDAVASIPADYSDLLAAIAPDYTGLTFPVTAGTWCWYNGSLRRAVVDIPSTESWTAAHWETAPLSNALAGDIADLRSDIMTSKPVALSASDFSIGTIHSSTGQNNSSSTRARLNNAIYLRAWSTISVADNKFAVYKYTDSEASQAGFKGIVHALAASADAYEVSDDAWYRILLAFSDNSTVTDANIATLVGTLSVTACVPDFLTDKTGVALTAQTVTADQKRQARDNIGASQKVGVWGEATMTVYPYITSRANLSSSSGASVGSSNKVVTTNYIYLHAGSHVVITGGYKFSVYPYGADRAYNSSQYVNSVVDYYATATGYYRFQISRTDGGVIPDTDIVTILSGFTVQAARNLAIVPADYDMIVPEFIPVAAGRQYNIYHSNMIYGANGNKLDRVLIDSVSFVTYDDFDRWEPTGSSSGSVSNVYANAYFNSMLTFDDSKGIKIQRIGSDAGNGLTKNIMIIGDSLTGGYSTIRTELVSLFADDVMSITLIGTRHDAPYNSEARSGWGYNTYYNNQTRSGDTETNPFWNPSTEHFDFSYYKAQNPSVPDPDYVLLCLGTNDYSGYTIANTITAADAIINSIHAYSADIKIALWLPPIPCTLQHNNTGASDMYKLIMALIGRYSGRQSELIYTIPVYLAVDTKHDYRVEEVAIDARNTEYKMLVPTDNLHPTVAGFEKIADVLYSFIKYLGSVDETTP